MMRWCVHCIDTINRYNIKNRKETMYNCDFAETGDASDDKCFMRRDFSCAKQIGYPRVFHSYLVYLLRRRSALTDATTYHQTPTPLPSPPPPVSVSVSVSGWHSSSKASGNPLRKRTERTQSDARGVVWWCWCKGLVGPNWTSRPTTP